MEIPLFQQDEPLKFQRIVLYPYPDLRRIWARVWITPVPDKQPNVELRVLNADGSENTSVYMMMRSEERIETTLHVRNGVPGATYRVVAELSLGLGDDPEIIDHREFDLTLEFRDPEARQPGFGVGVDWAELAQGAEEP